jgi:hypothetical protein
LAVNVKDHETTKNKDEQEHRDETVVNSFKVRKERVVPFKYQNTKDGKPQTIEVNGNAKS